jgi:hypothetical protein
MQTHVAKISVPELDTMPPGDREKVAEFLHSQADEIMQSGAGKRQYEAKIVDMEDGYHTIISVALDVELENADG